MTTTPDRAAPRDLAAEFPARLSLTPKTTLAGQLDGAWWPFSRDLEAELPPLVAALDEARERITRVTVNPSRWPGRTTPAGPARSPLATGRTCHAIRPCERAER
jgi:hypothetical protein